MKRKNLPLLIIMYLTTIAIFRKYPESHICSFFIGTSCALTVVFFIYMIKKKINHDTK